MEVRPPPTHAIRMRLAETVIGAYCRFIELGMSPRKTVFPGWTQVHGQVRWQGPMLLLPLLLVVSEVGIDQGAADSIYTCPRASWHECPAMEPIIGEMRVHRA